MVIFCNAYTVQLNEVASGNGGTGGSRLSAVTKETAHCFKSSFQQRNQLIPHSDSPRGTSGNTWWGLQLWEARKQRILSWESFTSANPQGQTPPLQRANFKWVKAFALLEQPPKRKFEREYPSPACDLFSSKENAYQAEMFESSRPGHVSALLRCSTHSPTPQSLGIRGEVKNRWWSWCQDTTAN